MMRMFRYVIGFLNLYSAKNERPLRGFFSRLIKFGIIFTTLVMIIGIAIGAWLSKTYL